MCSNVSRASVQVETTIKLTYNNLAMLPIVIEIRKESNEWTCQFGHRLYSGLGTCPRKIVLEILNAMKAELNQSYETAKECIPGGDPEK